MAQPKNLAPNLWIVDQPDFSIGIGKIGTRMTVIKLASGGLFLHSPTKLDDETKRALDAIGEVRAVVTPSRGRGNSSPTSPQKNLRAKWRPRHFAIGTGCRGHPCRGSLKPAEGFTFN